jgi:hypothetical protein
MRHGFVPDGVKGPRASLSIVGVFNDKLTVAGPEHSFAARMPGDPVRREPRIGTAIVRGERIHGPPALVSVQAGVGRAWTRYIARTCAPRPQAAHWPGFTKSRDLGRESEEPGVALEILR